MKIIEELLSTLQDGKIIELRVGLHWTAVVAEINGVRQCGLASTLSLPHDHSHGADVPEAGDLLHRSAFDLASEAMSEIPTMSSIGIATINALIKQDKNPFMEMNADDSSPFYKRIIISEEKKTPERCLTLQTIKSWALSKVNFFGKLRGDNLISTGYLSEIDMRREKRT